MKILGEKELNKNNTIEEIKDLMLYKVMLFSGIIGVPVVLYNVYFAFGAGITHTGLINLILFLPIVSVIFFYRKISYKIRARILVNSVTMMALYNFYIAGYTGAGYLLLLSVISFATAFLNKKEALIQIIICILIASVSGILFIAGIWKINYNLEDMLKLPNSWLMSVAVFAFLSFMFFLVYNIIQYKLIQKIDEEQANNVILENSNARLQELLVRQESHQKELLKAKIKAEESNNLKTEFLHNMSHEVRTPLNGVMGFSRLLKKENLSDEKRTQFADIIIHSSETLQKVIDDILEISFLETKQISVEIKNFSAFEFLQDLYLVFNLKSKSNVDIKMVSPEIDFYLNSDPHKLHKIMSNLIENALKFTEKGFVEFGCCQSGKENICFYVKDSGIGISSENMERIFSRFSQEHDSIASKYGGLGLGLCIAKENTELLKGNIRVESKKGKGTTFYVEIPRSLN